MSNIDTSKNMLKENDQIPEFEIAGDCAGNIIKSSDFLGKSLVIFFYPKDNTPGCTLEAKNFTEYYDDFKALDCEIVGISRDSMKQHKKFKETHSLLPILGSDPDNITLGVFGVWKEKSMIGVKYMGIERSTFLIDKTGKIRKIWRGVKIAGHVEEVFATLEKMDS